MEMHKTEPLTEFSQRANFLGEELEDAVWRARLKSLASKATAILNQEGLSEIGSLSVAEARHDDDWSYPSNLRSEPSKTHGGAELRFPLQRSDFFADDEDVIRQIMTSAHRFVGTEELIAAKVNKARSMAEDLIASKLNFGWPAKLVSIGCEYGFADSLVFDIDILEQDLTMSRYRVLSLQPAKVDHELIAVLDVHEDRDFLRNKLRAAGFSYLVNGTARTILDAVGLGVPNTVLELRSKRVIEFRVLGTDGRKYEGAAYWDNGVLMANLKTEDNLIQLQNDELTLFETVVPEILIATLLGRRLGDLIELPWLSAEALITDVQGTPDELCVKVRCPRFGMTGAGLKLCESPLQASPLL